jgi:hypothetical protein
MKTIPIKSFWTKLLADTYWANLKPPYYMDLALNARIDWGIKPRLWRTTLKTSTIWTVNMGSFSLDWELYQITNGSIYLVNQTTWSQTQKITLLHNKPVDIATYIFPKWRLTLLNTYNTSYDYSPSLVWRLYYDRENKKILHQLFLFNSLTINELMEKSKKKYSEYIIEFWYGL